MNDKGLDTLNGKVYQHILSIEKALAGIDLSDDLKKQLADAKKLTLDVETYCTAKSSPLSPGMEKLKQDTWKEDFRSKFDEGKAFSRHNPAMITGTGQIQLLQILARLRGAKNVLEVGGFTGFGALGMSEAIVPEGMVTTIELDPYLCSHIKKVAEENKRNIQVLQGKALEVLQSLARDKKQYDLIYVDCIKKEYPQYYKIMMEGNMLSENGVIAFDNCFQRGHCILRDVENGVVVDDFNTMITADERVENTLVGIYDGLMLVQRKAR